MSLLRMPLPGHAPARALTGPRAPALPHPRKEVLMSWLTQSARALSRALVFAADADVHAPRPADEPRWVRDVTPGR